MTPRQDGIDMKGARALGWASIGIGLAEIIAPRQVETLLGIRGSNQQRGVLRMLGVRELMHGAAILTEHKPSHEMAASLWARVMGDLLDTVLLGLAATKTRRPGSFAAVAGMVMGIGLSDLVFAGRLARRHR